jgi:hypothetical protein
MGYYYTPKQTTLMPMLSYSKMILSKMTIDIQLFKKELKKAYHMLKSDEIIELNTWLMRTYPDFIKRGNVLLVQ